MLSGESLTCVSGYWNVDNKHGHNKYEEWFKNSLRINCPYVFFSNKEGIEIIKKHRRELPTHYVELNIEEFQTNKHKEMMRVDPVHSPSRELNMIWNEKIFLIQRAKELNPYNSDYFMWIDAGICIYRNESPPRSIFPNPEKISKLPKDRFIYSQSNAYDESLVKETVYYHHVSGTCYIMPIAIIDMFAELYNSYMERLFSEDNIWTDQVVLTHIYKDKKHLFCKLCDGYGELVRYLYV